MLRFRVTTWNSEWAAPSTRRGERVQRILIETRSDVIVLTEGCRELLPPGGFVVEGQSDWGYSTRGDSRRKVLLWSRVPLTASDDVGDPRLPSGRYVAATLDTTFGDVRVVGVCVPWSGAHVTTGRRDRRRWEDHHDYLDVLGPLLRREHGMLVIAGDFNQQLPRAHQPADTYARLIRALGSMTVHTSTNGESALIDHVAASQEFQLAKLSVIDRKDTESRLSDHLGVVVDLKLASQQKVGTSLPSG